MAENPVNVGTAYPALEVPAETEELKYKPSEKAIQVIRDTFGEFRLAQDERDRNFEYMDGIDPITYINDSVRRFTTNVDVRDDIDEWQSIVHLPFTRNKVLSILGKIVDALPTVEVQPRGGEDALRGEILNSLFEYAEDVDDADEFLVFMLEEAIVKGTAVGYEGIETKKRKVREIVRYTNEADFSVVETTITERKLTSVIVPLEEFYPYSVGIRKIQDMPRVFWRKIVDFSKFKADFSNYENSKYVVPFRTANSNSVEMPFYTDYISSDVGEDNVEIIRKYDKENDCFIILANGVWLNPMGNDIESPIPFNHKKLPFWSMIYDIFGSDFFYGKSLADRIKVLQDVMNVLNNMLLDQSFLTVFSPILMSGQDDIDDDFLVPGRRIPIDTAGLPINQAVQKLDMGTPGGWHQFILQYTKDIIEESSIDRVNSGVAGVGERTTATEIRNAAAGLVTLLGLFARFVRFGLKERARLRVANIMQFYTDPKYPILEGVTGEGGSAIAKKAFNMFTVGSSALTPGKRGEKTIMVFQNKEDLPTANSLRVETKLDEIASGKKITKFAILPEYIRGFEFDIKLVASTKTEESKEVNKALEIQFQQTLNALYPDLVDRTEMAATLIEMFGKDPSKILLEKSAEGGAPTQPGTGMSGGDNAQNTIKGAGGIAPSGSDMKNLMGQMMG